MFNENKLAEEDINISGIFDSAKKSGNPVKPH